jgi:hypothetical protein
MINPGRYAARAVATELGLTKGGNDQIAVELELADGEHSGERIVWYGYFTEKTAKRTVESLRICGWNGDDIAASPLPGLGSREVEIVVEMEDDLEGVPRARVRWINRAGGAGIAMKTPMDDARKRQFAASMRGLANATPTLPPDAGAPVQVAPARPATPPARPAARPDSEPPQDRWPTTPPGDDEIPF